ncbi:MAG TPA: TRAM domain-containing protein [Jatrophihabitans sp.]|jgi:tRNA/tmRNA/rRNA uracil-C5-methylase (TrmA/RlmC/RlmD family)
MFTPGDIVELEVGAPAHGGFCVSRVEGRGVCFVSHALPGELVRARVTEDRGGSFFRADAIEVLRASPDRVTPPCPHAGPGRCGGCDWQHASGDAQRRLKESVVREQFRRLAKYELPDSFLVEPLPAGSGDEVLLGWRSRITYAVDEDGRPGLHRHRSTEVERIERCPLGVPGVGDSDVLAQQWPGLLGVAVVQDGTGEQAVIAHRPGVGRQSRGRRPPDRLEVIAGAETLTFRVLGRELQVAATGFWQVHPNALHTFTTALLDGTRPQPGEGVLDLYAGAGALTVALAAAVGQTGRAVGIESDHRAVADAATALAAMPWARVLPGRLDETSIERMLELADLSPDVIVLDPPRAGAGQAVMRALLDRGPRVIGYVACDPAALARDAAVAFAAGWQLDSLRGFDAFPMTHHVECVATFTRL